ncbi:MAG: alanine dehydrogenase [Deltaproteobacteria bacterium]|nr:alanine dehydrogenase [Deltaproteobacteria bacterium]
MIIGVPKEIKVQEYRVGVTPAGVQKLSSAGHTVLVQKGAGVGSGLSDEEYVRWGGTVVDTAEEVWGRSEMIIKVKEPIAPEYKLFREGQIIYTYFHLAAVPELAPHLLEKKVAAVAYETIQLPNGNLPLLQPMSEVAGRMAIQVGASCLEKERGGKGVLLGGVPGVRPGKVAIIGGGTVGTHAAKMAMGTGAQVRILDVNVDRLRYLDDLYGGRLVTLYSDPATIRDSVIWCDLLVGAVLVTGARAPLLVSEELIAQMEPGSVIVDVAVDQGGCIATCKPTTHEDPTYVKHGVIHYCVANMPGAVSRTSTFALTNVTIGYGELLANLGLKGAIAARSEVAGGFNTYAGKVTHKAVAEALSLPYTPLSALL